MPDWLYERDALAWAETQADLLRRLAAGELVNQAIDWPNVIEEVQDVGISELRSCESLFLHGMLHVLKLASWPNSRSVEHWRDEADAFLNDAARRYTPSMRRRLAVPDLYAEALRRVSRKHDESGGSLALPTACPFTLDELLKGDMAARVAKAAS